MGVLDTFYILFKTDADEAAREVDSVGRAADGTEKKLHRMDSAAAGLSRSFLGMAAAFAAPIVSLISLNSAFNTALARVNAIDDIADAAGKLRSSAQDYDAFTRAVQGTGGSLAAAQADLSTFSDKLSDAAARPDGPNAKNFAKWGILFKDVNGEAVGAVDGILSLAKSLEGVNQAEAIGRLRRLGVTDADTIALLLEGKQAIQEKMNAEKRAGVVTEEQIRISGEYQAALGQSKNMMDTFGNALMESIVPALTRGVQAFSKAFGWLMGNRVLVEGFFIGVAGAVTLYFLPALASAAVAVVAATWPFLAIGTAIAAVGAAFALAYEDVRAFMDGQPSLIGELVERYEWFGDIVRGIGAVFEFLRDVGAAAMEGINAAITTAIELAGRYAAAWMDFWGQFRPIFDAIVEYWSAVADLVSAVAERVSGDLLGALVSFGEKASEAFNAFMSDIEPITGAVSTAAGAIQQGFTGAFNAVMSVWNNTIGLIAGKISAIADKIRGLAASIRGGGEEAASVDANAVANDNMANAGYAIGNSVRLGQNALAAAGGSSLGSTTSGAIAAAGSTTNQTSTVNVGDVTVNTQATDTKAIVGAVRGELQNQLRNTAAQFDDGVDR